MRRLLIVEQEPVLADILAFRLELLGYRVEAVFHADEAAGRMVGSRPDCVIVDLDSEGALGLLERMGADAELSTIPTLAMSTRDELDLVQRAFVAGAGDFLVVPFDPAIMQQKVADLTARNIVDTAKGAKS